MVRYWCSSISVLNLTLLVMKNSIKTLDTLCGMREIAVDVIVFERPCSLYINMINLISRVVWCFARAKSGASTYLHIPSWQNYVKGMSWYITYMPMTLSSMAFKPYGMTPKYDAISRTRACVADLGIWMNDDYFKLNADKSELLNNTWRLVHRSRSVSKLSIWSSTKN